MKAVDLHRKLEENTGLLIFGILFVDLCLHHTKEKLPVQVRLSFADFS